MNVSLHTPEFCRRGFGPRCGVSAAIPPLSRAGNAPARLVRCAEGTLSPARRFIRFFPLSFCLFLLFFSTTQAAEISVRNPRLVASEEGYKLSADFNIVFNKRLEEVINKGVMLYFVVDFELLRSRWYWFDEQIAQRSRTFQLSYHALTRQYRLSSGPLHQSFSTLDEAVALMSQLRNWQAVEKLKLADNAVYQASLRLRLDLSQMPKTFQVSALSSRDWNLASDWLRWSFSPQELLLPVAAERTKPASAEGGEPMPGLKPAGAVKPPLPPLTDAEKEAELKETAPKEVTPKEVTPKEVTPKEVTPKETVPKEAMP